MITDLQLANLGINPEEYEALTEEEKQAVNQILSEISVNKESQTFEDLYTLDYKEVPVSFEEFISSERYLGKSTRHGEFLYPFWKKEAARIFARTDINEVALSGCLSGDTLIPLIDGTRVPIKDLVGRKNFKVYSYDLETNGYTVGNATRAFSTGYKMTYTVTFDNGKKIRITGNHKFLTRDKHYKSIDDGLKVGDSIMPFDSYDEKGKVIVSIYLNDIEEVFDIEVERYHNFALEAGVIVHNSIGVGKTTAAVLMMAYHLYKTMCMKDPQNFFNLSPGSEITYAFINNTLSSSYGVGFKTLQSFLQESPWFLDHGRIYGRTDIQYYPEDGFGFIVGSRPQHTLGRHIICLTGDTKIITSEGIKEIKDFENKKLKVFSYDEKSHKIVLSKDCEIKCTGVTSELIEITLDDKSTIRCTPDHRFLFKSGIYKCAKDLIKGDKLEYSNLIICDVKVINTNTPVKVYDVINAKPFNNFLIKTETSNIVSHNCSLMDEVSFAPGQNVSYEKCLSGDTVIRTTEGDFELKDLEGKKLKVLSYSPEGDIVVSEECTVIKTMETQDIVEICTEDNHIIRCTPFHRLMLKDGTYKMAKDLTEDDDLLSVIKYLKIKKVSQIKYENPVPVYDVINADPYHNFLIKTNSSYIVSHNSKIMSVYTNIRRRMESRFMVEGKMYGLMFLVSSKATESSFLEAYIADQVKKGYPIYVVDQPLWKVKPTAYSGKMFKVAVGNKFLPSRVIKGDTQEEIDAQCEAFKKQGMNVIDVPIEHVQAFDQDIDKALQDIAGISTSTVTKAFSMMRIQECVSTELENPFSTEVVTLGTHDPLKLQDFFDPSKIPNEVFNAPVFIHLDASVSGDRTGLSGVAIVGTKSVITYGQDVGEEAVSEELVYQQVFTVGIQAPSDAEISFEKTRQFIYYLKDEVGLNIKLISCDGFQSTDLRQILNTKGYETAYTSLDRTPDGYDGLKSAINDQRIILLKGCSELWDELSELERDNMTRKYDHPVGGCLPEYQKVITNHGPKRIVDLIEGEDKVYSYDPSTGKFEFVDFINLRKTRDDDVLYHISTKDGKSFDCTGNHPVLTVEGYKRAEDLKEGDEIVSVPEFPLYTNRKRGKPVKIDIESYKELIIYFYNNLKCSTGEISQITGLSKGFINYWLYEWGFLRNHSEAQKVAMTKYPSLLCTSNIEKEVVDYYISKGLEVKPQYFIAGSTHPYDMYLPEYNLIVEVDGVYWHRDCQETDYKNALYAVSAGYNIVRITDEDCHKFGRSLYEKILDKSTWIDLAPDKTLTDRYLKRLQYLKGKEPKLKELPEGIRTTKGLIKVHKGDKVEIISPEDFDYYISQGYERGSNLGLKLSDHPRYNHSIDLNEFKEFVGSRRERSLQDLRDHYGVSDNCIRCRVKQVYPGMSFDNFKAKMLRGSSLWNIKKITSEAIDNGEICKVDTDEITKKEFIEKYKDYSYSQFKDLVGHSRRWICCWFEYIYQECSCDEYYK